MIVTDCLRSFKNTVGAVEGVVVTTRSAPATHSDAEAAADKGKEYLC